jgi:molybdopterin-guanine dinucleotide biosynthesis protein A
LLQFAKNSAPDADVVMPRGPSGYDQPLCAFYRTSCLAPALAALREGRFKVRTAFSDLHIAYWAVDDERERILSNANTPEEWDRLQRINPLE